MPSSATIECELRTFITAEQHASLLRRFSGGEPDEGDEQITYYFEGNGNPDLRIQKNASGAKVWMKKGQLHEDAREEIEVPCAREDFENLEKLFVSLGYRVSIKWFRRRHTFEWDSISVMLDHTKGYGHILELEKLCSPDGREEALADLRARLEELEIPISPKQDFAARYADYKVRWPELTA